MMSDGVMTSDGVIFIIIEGRGPGVALLAQCTQALTCYQGNTSANITEYLQQRIHSYDTSI